MTDLTAAQTVERLKDTTAESWRWELAAATLIEQQAEQIAALTKERARLDTALDAMTDNWHDAELALSRANLIIKMTRDSLEQDHPTSALNRLNNYLEN